MGLDLDEILAGWERPEDEIAARLVTGRDGARLVQLRVDLGILQMHVDGRPDGRRYNGTATALEEMERALGADESAGEPLWSELHRELGQFNYRRLALLALLDHAGGGLQRDEERGLLRRAMQDTDHCLRILCIQERCGRGDAAFDIPMTPSLIVNRAKLLVRLHELDGRPEQAVEAAEEGVEALRRLLLDSGFSDLECDQEPSIAYLVQLGRRLRRRYKIDRTLKERLAEAVEKDDFETAARLHAELARRDADGNAKHE